MFCSKCGNKLDDGRKGCDHCDSQVGHLKEKSKLDGYVDDVVGKAIKGSFNGSEAGNKAIPAWVLYGIIIVAFILYYFL